MNPMIRKELRQRMRERRGWVLPSLYLLVLSGAVAFAYFFKTQDLFGFGELNEPQGAEVGVTIFLVSAYAQLTLLLLLAPVFSAGGLTIEKEQRTLAALLTSLLTSAQIWWGKFIASLLFLGLLLVSALPVLSLAFALGGVGWRELILVSVCTLVMLASMCAVGLYCSSYFRRSVHSTAVSYAVVIALTVLTFVATTLMSWYWQQEAGPGGTEEEMPDYVAAPLYLNPYVMLFSVFVRSGDDYPFWAISLKLFLAIACLAAALAMRNLERSGEQV
ncbi:MAG: hypothetical protein A3D93_00340 [Acidobacteria bacterium RIFCSPHIGHO2_12_FULL_67_30]|nr:MAG: hypothetical protein A2620_05325 [Acidobacteria bacterium RIFCSPHIGHO2_01_FULL_67_28]OFV88496.1 MAG: hypothetical protein A3D93_00340 [Acidobacteria bacterium RIFCSPHIGHO2_12_FULL_67_30]